MTRGNNNTIDELIIRNFGHPEELTLDELKDLDLMIDGGVEERILVVNVVPGIVG